ncbi:MAG: pentapeptide repeat-containing protein, partial [Desulfobulbaceae bacterium]|nr:pentapeptide repeat-containing protein [Desulfobulbaceae bacterium]
VVTALFIYLATVERDDDRADRILQIELEANWRRDLKRDAEFAGASLERMGLSGLYAPGLDISTAHAVDVDLSRSNLTGAHLAGGQYGGASFSHAALSGASFRGADVSGADFSGALLVNADLRVARADGADFSEATLFKADLRGVGLRGSAGRGEVGHPSVAPVDEFGGGQRCDGEGELGEA